MSRENKARLSKGVLEMKFMKRTKEKYEKDQFEAEQKALFSTSITQQLEGKEAIKKRFVIENSFVPCADLVAGRMSFKGRNPWIEKLNSREDAEVDDPNIKKEEGIQDEEFAELYSNTVDTMGKKFLRKRERTSIQSDQKFKRPRMDDE